MSKDFITNSILQSTANAIRYCDKTTNSIAPKDFADRIRELDKLIPQPDALNFYMPNGGTISLNKVGSPTVVELEYSLDRGLTWTVWAEDQDGNRSLTLTAGQRMYVRSTSETSTTFSLSDSDYYKFQFTDTVEAYGFVDSLLCRNINNAIISDYVFNNLFQSCKTLIKAPNILTTTPMKTGCFGKMFAYCSNLKTAPESLLSIIPGTTSCYQMFRDCSSLKKSPDIYLQSAVKYTLIYMFQGCSLLEEVRVRLINISDDSALYNWLKNVSAQGDFYCPASLTIPEGESGIPTGWTRHDI